MKKSLTIGSPRSYAIKKFLLVMKLSFLLVLLGSLQVSATVKGQTDITLKLDNTAISKVFTNIEKQGVYRFLYNSRLKDIQEQVSIDVSNTGIKEVLNKIFEGKDLTYKLLENNLIVVLSRLPALQDIQVTGKITGASGEILSGVSVTLKGTSRGTTTDNNGSFTLTVPENGTLVVSYIGYVDQEIPVNSQSVLNIKMEQSSKALDQVVVVGYGSQRKIDVTGATATVKGSELVKQPVLTATQAMQGKVAGVQITSSGQPGSQPSVRIRGTGSLIGGAEPLYVVDGIITSDITNINTADIVNVDILKDASSTAIYGARGSNGVILISTKQGARGKMQISYSGNVGIQSATHLVKMANAKQYADYVSAATFGITTV
ncbi:MAG TPA: carboxypeptidase-like regulatory domain-containing protein, partial [Puia sp.]|nr:carboxypeptidase-like regulatory domain-containing protein [Puia sp.]